MTALVFDRSLPVTPLENILDVQAMFTQVQTYLGGLVDPAAAVAQDAFTSRELAALSVDESKFAADLARRTAANRPGQPVRRQAYHALGVAFPLGVNVHATHTYTNESVNDVVFFAARASSNSPALANPHLRVRWAGISIDAGFGADVDTNAAPGVGMDGDQDWGFNRYLSSIGWVNFDAIGQTRNLTIESSVTGSGAGTFSEIALYSWMMELG